MRRYIKYNFIILLLLIFELNSSCFALPKINNATLKNSSRIIAIVNDENITVGYFAKWCEIISSDIRLNVVGTAKIEDQYGKAFTQLLIRIFVHNFLESKHIAVTFENIKEAEKNICAEYPTRQYFLDSLREENIDYNVWLARLQYQLELEVLSSYFKSEIKISEDQIVEYYNNNSVQFIEPESFRFVSISGINDTNALQAISMFQNKISLSDIIKIYPSFKVNYFNMENSVATKDWVKQFFDNEKNKFVESKDDDIDTTYVAYLGVVASYQKKITEVRQDIVDNITDEQMNIIFKEWLERQFANAKIIVKHNFFNVVKNTL